MRTKHIRDFLKFSYGDMVIIIALLVFTTIVFFYGNRGVKETVIVRVNGSTLYKLPVSKDTTITAQGYRGPFTFRIENKRVKMLNSTCPLRLCVKEGWISRPGDMIVCVPNRVKISFGVNKYDAIIK